MPAFGGKLGSTSGKLATFKLGAPGIQTFSDTASGGVVLGGAATLTVRVATPSGGGVLGGAAPDVQVVNHIPSGGVVLAGSPTLTARFAITVGGTVTLSGTMETLFLLELDPRGGVVISGSPGLRTVAAVSGGAALGGAAAPSLGEEVSGGGVLSGQITLSSTNGWVPDGGLILGGEVVVIVDILRRCVHYRPRRDPVVTRAARVDHVPRTAVRVDRTPTGRRRIDRAADTHTRPPVCREEI